MALEGYYTTLNFAKVCLNLAQVTWFRAPHGDPGGPPHVRLRGQHHQHHLPHQQRGHPASRGRKYLVLFLDGVSVYITSTGVIYF